MSQTTDEKIADHHAACSDHNELTYMKKPHWVIAPSVVVASILAISGVVVAYKNAQAEIERRQLKFEYDLVRVSTDCENTRKIIESNQEILIKTQNEILVEIKELRKGAN